MIPFPLNRGEFKLTACLRYAIPSSVSVVRVLLAGLLVTEINNWPEQALILAILGVPVVIALDAVDGILARRLKSQSVAGSFIDIAADRLVEAIFLQHFIRAGLIPLWFVLVFYGRIVLTDACRMFAFRMEKVPATGIILPKPWRKLVLSKLSRSGYGALKGVLFTVLLITLHQGRAELSLLELAILLSVLTFSILRAIPILFIYLPRIRNLISINLSGHRGLQVNEDATRMMKIVSGMQLASDVCLATVLVVLALS
jgi:CDP-diacylglycerol--glycerol-3-phosphate 3-phosphatidyltransferase